MKNMIKAPKVRTTQWKFSDFDEQEREEAALSSLLRKKKALTPKNVELEIEALMDAEMRAHPELFRGKNASPELLELRNGLGLINFELKQHELHLRQQAAIKKVASPRAKKKKTMTPAKSPKAFAKKALYDAKNTAKKDRKPQKVAAKTLTQFPSPKAPDMKRSASGTKKLAKRASLKARNDRYSPVEKDKKPLKHNSNRHTIRPASRAKKTDAAYGETKTKREIIVKPLTQEQRVKKLKKRVAMTRNPPSYH